MNPFTNFNHFIAFFVPGIFLTGTVLAFVSMVTGKNALPFVMALRPEASLTYVIVLAASLGLFLDELRHKWIEIPIEDRWAARKGYEGWPDLADDFIVYVSSPGSKVSLQAYLTMVDEFYHFYEFDINMGLALIPTALTVSFYLGKFYLPWNPYFPVLLVLPVALLGMALLFWIFGVDAYEYFLATFVDSLSMNDADFKRTLMGE